MNNSTSVAAPQLNDLMEIQSYVREELDRCLKFWLENGMDTENGGIYTCLDRQGNIYSTDKSVWMQGRCAFTFAHLCNVYGQRDEWLAASKSCLDFLEKYCINRESGNRMYFTVTKDGKPLRQRRYSFSEGFYCIANAEYYGVTKEKIYLERAKAAYDLIYNLNNQLMADPTGLGSKTITSTRAMRGLGEPMIFLNITSIMSRVDPENKELYDRHARECTDKIIKYHFKPELGFTLENVGLNGEFLSEISVGRILNPGHAIECSWFMAEFAKRQKDQKLYDDATTIFKQAINMGWDQEMGGLLYFIDALGNPPESYEHDMKLWWPHNEILIASLMFYRDTNKLEYFEHFAKTLTYCQKYFSDPAYGEWYGYLRRDGRPTEPACKGSTFKGPFHLPRCLIMVDKMLTELITRAEN